MTLSKFLCLQIYLLIMMGITNMVKSFFQVLAKLTLMTMSFTPKRLQPISRLLFSLSTLCIHFIQKSGNLSSSFVVSAKNNNYRFDLYIVRLIHQSLSALHYYYPGHWIHYHSCTRKVHLLNSLGSILARTSSKKEAHTCQISLQSRSHPTGYPFILLGGE